MLYNVESDGDKTMNVEYLRIRKASAVAGFKILLRHSPGQTKQNHTYSRSG